MIALTREEKEVLYKKHLKMKPSNAKPAMRKKLRCAICGIKFHKYELNQRASIDSNKGYVCDRCGMKLITQKLERRKKAKW